MTSDVYDPHGKKVTETLAYGTTLAAATIYEFDLDDRLTGLIDPNNQTTSFAYDILGDKTWLKDPLNHTATMSYDGDMRLTKSIDRDTRTIAYAFDAIGDELKETWYNSGGTATDTLSFTYDGDSDLLTAGNSNGTYTFTYNPLNEVTKVVEPVGMTLTFAYDGAGNRTLVTDSQSGTLQSFYDTNNRLVQEDYLKTGSTMLMYAAMTYDWAGRVEEMIQMDTPGVMLMIEDVSYTYDARNEVTSIVSTNGGGSVDSFAYFYNLNGEITKEIDAGTTTTTYGYDAQGQLTAAGTATFAFDKAGDNTSYTYNASSKNQLTSDGTWTYAYDNEGNEISKYKTNDTWTYTYDNKNELTSALEETGSGGSGGSGITNAVSAAYKYDALGNEIEEDVWTPVGGGSGGGSGGSGGISYTETVQKYAIDAWDPAKRGRPGQRRRRHPRRFKQRRHRAIVVHEWRQRGPVAGASRQERRHADALLLPDGRPGLDPRRFGRQRRGARPRHLHRLRQRLLREDLQLQRHARRLDHRQLPRPLRLGHLRLRYGQQNGPRQRTLVRSANRSLDPAGPPGLRRRR